MIFSWSTVTDRSRERYGGYTPAQALGHARRLLTREGCDRGLYAISDKFALRLHEVDLDPGDEEGYHAAVQAVVHEARPEDFQPMKEPYEKDPGYGFEFFSAYLGRPVYFKFRLIGSKPKVDVNSLHTPDRLLKRR